ncbi:MAG: flagellar basal-body rod protein FlgF [Alphaproteobacteria bacterium]|nr:flagellar basal-body rod protein FlgF [Alphaproteobacteria bacterium]
MENTIYLGLSRQIVLQTNLDIVANNIANVNTNGFREQSPVFEEYLSDPRGNGDPLSFVLDYGEYQNTAPGPLSQTGNPLNVALNGPGFLAVQLPDGSTGYTRDGNFIKTSDGTLVSSAGYPILGSGGPITVPADATEFVVDERGVVSDQHGQIGRLKIVEFDDLQTLKPAGNNVYTTTSPEKEAQKTVVRQGFLEGSNVQPVVEMTRMIKILRYFQGVQKMLDTEHDRQREAIQRLTGSQA